MEADATVMVEFFGLSRSTEQPRFQEVSKHRASVRLPWAVVKDLKTFRLEGVLYAVHGAYWDVESSSYVVFLSHDQTFNIIGADKAEIPANDVVVY